MITRRTRVGMFLAVALLGLAACGGDGAVSSDSATETTVQADAAGSGSGSALRASLVKAGEATSGVESGRFEMTMGAEGSGAGAFSIAANGEFTDAGERVHFLMDLGDLFTSLSESDASVPAELGDLGSIEFVQDGATTYLKSAMLGSLLSSDASKPWVKLDGGFGGDSVLQRTGGFGPASSEQLLNLLAGADEVTEVGAEQVRGVDTTHYQGTFDPRTAAANLPADQQAAFEEQMSALGANVTIPTEVWVDGDGYVRRMMLSFSGEALGGTGTATMTMEYFDFNADVSVEVPPADQVAEASNLGGAPATTTG